MYSPRCRPRATPASARMLTTAARSFASCPSGRSGYSLKRVSVTIRPSTESPRNSSRSLVGSPPFSYANERGVITWRRLYVPQVGHAVCGSFCARHWGQVTSCGAVVFHWARRDLVLLRDILRFGTATSALLSCLRHGGTVRRWFCGARVGVGMSSSRVRKPRSAFGAQTRAILGAQRRERQLEHQRVAQGRLEVEQVPVQKIPVSVLVARVMGEQLGELYLCRRSEQIQTTRALPHQRRPHRCGHHHAVGDPLEPDIQLEIGTLGNADQLDAKARGRRYGPDHGAHVGKT